MLDKSHPGQAKVSIPADLEKAFRTNPAAREAFDNLPPSHQREYIVWIAEAKRETTRQDRIEKTLAMLLEKK